MGKFLVAIAVFAVFPLLLAQQTLNNDSVIKMVKMGFPEDRIVNAINRSPGTYDTSVDGLNALKNLGLAITWSRQWYRNPPWLRRLPSCRRRLWLLSSHNRPVLLPQGDCMLRSALRPHRVLLSTVIITETAMATTQATLGTFP
jgi:hypothetical protein